MKQRTLATFVATTALAAVYRTNFEANPAGKKQVYIENGDGTDSALGAGGDSAVIKNTVEALVGAGTGVVSDAAKPAVEQQQQGQSDGNGVQQGDGDGKPGSYIARDLAQAAALQQQGQIATDAGSTQMGANEEQAFVNTAAPKAAGPTDADPANAAEGLVQTA